MRLLILGGTVFLGRHIVEAALARGHQVTLFHRGRRGAELFEGQVERVLGDRDGGLDALGGRTWDAVVDTSGYFPRVVGASAGFFASRVGRYLFVSTISVYQVAGLDRIDEDSPVHTLEDPAVETIDAETYGGLKVLCEQGVQRALGDRALVVRPGLIVGPHDPTDRFTYWPLRFARGGDVLAPDRRDQPNQVIDVRDLAEFCVHALETGQSGVFNGTGPDHPLSLGETLERCRAISNPDARIVWAPPAWLEEQGAQPWSELPMYLGPTGEDDAMMRADLSRAIAAGLRLRPLEETVRDTLAWAQSRAPGPLKAGLSKERERELLGRLIQQKEA